MYIQKQKKTSFWKNFNFSTKIRRLQVHRDAAGGEFFPYYSSSQLKVFKYLSLNHLTRRFLQNRRVLRRQTPRRPHETRAIASSVLRNMRRRSPLSGGRGWEKVTATRVVAVTWPPSAIQKGLRLRLNGGHHVKECRISGDNTRHVGGRWLVYLGRKVQKFPCREAVGHH